ncbi:MAG: hypothetical protein HFJ45_09595 [Clostridia bacterium]|nr:hypothetical protein [Clostridia bacterium]
MDIYNLINSKAISEHCRKIQHKFNTEELAVLIYRNKRLSIDEKIELYKELITDYPDMEVIERINCKHYNSVKDMIRGEIQRVKDLIEKLEKEESNVIYTYNSSWYNGYRIIEGKNEYRDVYTNLKEVKQLIDEDIKDDEDNELLSFRITKRPLNKENNYEISAEYLVTESKELKMINIYDFKGDWLDISNIFLNIPTPFKEGDLLVSTSKTPFGEGHILSYDKYPFVLYYLATWRENLQPLLDKGNYDSSDMQGLGYYISEYGLVLDNNHDYDSWEYFEGELKGESRILKAISSFMKGEISLDLLLETYKYILSDKEVKGAFWYGFTDDGLRLVGLTEGDIEKVNGKNNNR